MTQPKIDVQSQARRANVTLESFIFPQNFEKNTNHVIKSSVEYYLSKGNKQKTDKVIGNLKRVFGPESMEGFSVKNSDLALKKIVEDVRKSTSPTIGNFVSDEAKKQIDAIVAELRVCFVSLFGESVDDNGNEGNSEHGLRTFYRFL
ncbi:MAG: hypothetical protein EAZ91_24100, partial [Cytophagales bacterium]